ncbi:hypothetical protein [Robbsia sp. KACC 23696]|uniref:hypothetical protein n=1 Tax=Robbsia sp. KACC 23696 TaxID=3149231 RepID=UPI00325BDE0F
MGQSGAVLVHEDAVTMSIDPPAVLIPPMPGPLGKLDAGHGGAGQAVVRIDGSPVCVLGVETSVTADAKYMKPPYGLLTSVPPGVPGTMTLTVQSGSIATSAFVRIDGKAVLWRDGGTLKVEGKVEKLGAAQFIPPPPAPPKPELDPTSQYSGSGTILRTNQAFVTVSA